MYDTMSYYYVTLTVFFSSYISCIIHDTSYDTSYTMFIPIHYSMRLYYV